MRWHCLHPVKLRAWRVFVRVQLHERQTTWAKTASGVGTVRRNGVVRERQTRERTNWPRWIGRGANAEVALALQVGWHRRDPRHAAHFAAPLLRPKEEQFVLLDGPAEGIPKVVGAQFGFGLAGLIQEKVIGIE